MVNPAWQGLGLGTAILRHTADYAKEQGLRGFTADILCDNQGMLRTLEHLGLHTTKSVAQGAYEVVSLFSA
jgi:GNAT superfamily N-acetyltransferase